MRTPTAALGRAPSNVDVNQVRVGHSHARPMMSRGGDFIEEERFTGDTR